MKLNVIYINIIIVSLIFENIDTVSDQFFGVLIGSESEVHFEGNIKKKKHKNGNDWSILQHEIRLESNWEANR